jgi:hypothetical protein
MRPKDYTDQTRKDDNRFESTAETPITVEEYENLILKYGAQPDTRDPIDIAYENGELYMDEDNTYLYDEGMYSE